LSGRPINDPGTAGGYLALFSEIGFVFLVTTLAGALAGHWLDGRLGTNPILVVIGLLVGFGIGAIGAARLIKRFLARFE
jgi:F0F1-type ATP synthase assembly protein I